MKVRLLTTHIAPTAAAILAVSLQTMSFGAALPIDPHTTLTATMDGGLSKAGNSWYEIGVNTAAPTTGLKTGLVSGQTDTNSTYFFQSATSLNALMLDTGKTVGRITFAEPTAVHALSLAGASGNGGGTLNMLVEFTNGTVIKLGPVVVGDWFGNTSIVQTVNGRIDCDANSYNNVGAAANNPRVLAINTNLPASETNNAISAIQFSWTGAGPTTHTMIFGVSGDTNGLGHFAPIALTPESYNQDIIVGVAEISQNAYLQEHLVSDITNITAVSIDTNLVNPWGITASASSPFWVSDNGTGLSTIYNTTGGVQSLVVTIPSPTAGSKGRPTGIVFNGNTNDFIIPVSTSNAPAHFIFATEDGTIAAWANASDTNAHLAVDNSAEKAVYKGLAVASLSKGTNAASNYLYAADFHNGAIDVFDSTFKAVTNGFPLTTNGAPFSDTNVPAGFAPFNIQCLGGRLLVTYAKQDTNGFFDVPGPGNGYLDVFDTSGDLLKRLITTTNGPLDSPWGLALAPESFGPFSGQLLVGNFGDGRINVFDPSLGTFLGQLLGTNATPISIPGLWGLLPGNGGNGGETNKLYFTAGILSNGIPVHGLLGSLSFPTGDAVEVPWELLQTVNGYQDNFEAAKRNTNWLAVGPGGDHYIQTNNVLQVATSAGDPNHLIYVGAGASNNVQEILARIRVLAFTPGGTNDAPRGGVGAGVNTNININSSFTNWSGYNIQFRDNAQDGVPGRQWKFLDDLRAWGPPGLRTNIPGQTTLGWDNKVWYWLRLRMDPKADGVNDVFGKVWVADGVTPEPPEWQMTWPSPPTPLHSGWAGITACSASGLAQTEADYVLIKSSGLPSTKVNFAIPGAGPVDPVINHIARSTNNIVVDWFGGTLQHGTNVFGGTWTDVFTSTPYTFPIGTAPENFFRVSQ